MVNLFHASMRNLVFFSESSRRPFQRFSAWVGGVEAGQDLIIPATGW